MHRAGFHPRRFFTMKPATHGGKRPNAERKALREEVAV
jgi:hypothetical protein